MTVDKQALMAGLVAETAVCLFENAGSAADYRRLNTVLQENMGSAPFIMTDELEGLLVGFVPTDNPAVYCEFANGTYFAGETGLINGTWPAVIGGFGNSLSSAPGSLLVHYNALDYLLENNLA